MSINLFRLDLFLKPNKMKKMGPTPFQYLPSQAKCAIEFLDAQGYGNQSIRKLDQYLDHCLRTQRAKVIFATDPGPASMVHAKCHPNDGSKVQQ